MAYVGCPDSRRILAISAVVVAGFLLVATPPGRAQLSPGPLSEAHSAQDSLFECTSCHALGVGRAEFRCTDCHTEIRDRIAVKRGYHARIVPADTGNESCASCHAEHIGRDFEIIRWPTSREEFDHNEAGYRLEGQHAALGCDDCHRPENMVVRERAGIIMDLDRSMLGLSADCVSCHEDEHAGQFAADCTTCHSLASWVPASGFAHENTRFPLTGLHANTACEQCHSTNAGGVTEFSDVPYQTCQSCHTDPHLGAFDATCDSCHNTTGWNNVGRTFDFDHGTTRFPLEGGHLGESCASCHDDTSFTDPVPHDRCLDCHADYHSGQFVLRDDGGDCESCHNVDTFETSTFTSQRHDETTYPLLGMHRDVECDSCHAPALENTDYHPTYEGCLDCHVDTHDAQFAHLSAGACESCHTVDGFRPSTYTLDQHDLSRFPLTGAHQAVVCFSCHTPLSEDADSGLRFQMDDLSCESCHDDPHTSTSAVDARSADVEECETCHDTRAWDVLPGFDHAITEFPLLGAHRVATCESCHQESASPAGPTIQFGSTPETCAECHEDVHAGQFAGPGELTDCGTCHQAASWLQTRFDHEEDSSFPLEGAHEVVACTMCHVDRENIDGEIVRVFSGTPTECAECHQ